MTMGVLRARAVPLLIRRAETSRTTFHGPQGSRSTVPATLVIDFGS